jgi:hypothetical protein
VHGRNAGPLQNSVRDFICSHGFGVSVGCQQRNRGEKSQG